MSYFIFFILFIFQVQTEAPYQVVFSSPYAWGGSSKLSLGGKEALWKKRGDRCLTKCETIRSQDECCTSQVICCHAFSANNARQGVVERERGKGGEKENECDVYQETGEEERERGKGGEKENECDVYHETGKEERERGKGGGKENECDVCQERGEEEGCYVFSDNTCVVCVRVVFAGQCIFHS